MLDIHVIFIVHVLFELLCVRKFALQPWKSKTRKMSNVKILNVLKREQMRAVCLSTFRFKKIKHGGIEL